MGSERNGLIWFGSGQVFETLEKGKVNEHNAQLTSISEFVPQSQQMAQVLSIRYNEISFFFSVNFD